MKVKLYVLRITALLCIFTMPSAFTQPKLNGVAIHEELGAEQFIAAVYSDTPTSSSRQLLLANENKAMEIRVLADRLYSRRFKRMWVEGIAINAGPTDLERHAQDLADFTSILRVKFKQGDVLRISRVMGKGTLISINGLHLGSIKNTRFFDLLLRTWVGPVPLSSDFKQTLLANGHIPKRTLRRFKATNPSPNRLASLTRALKAENKEPLPSKVVAVAKIVPPPPIVIPIPVEPIKPAVSPELADPKAPTPALIASLPKDSIYDEDQIFKDEDIFSDEGDDQPFSAESLLNEQLYISKLTKWTGQFVKYPRHAINHNQEGTVRITVSLARDGRVTDVIITDKSVHEHLNRAAKKAIKQASPYPSMPDDVKGAGFRFTVPVVFRLN